MSPYMAIAIRENEGVGYNPMLFLYRAVFYPNTRETSTIQMGGHWIGSGAP